MLMPSLRINSFSDLPPSIQERNRSKATDDVASEKSPSLSKQADTGQGEGVKGRINAPVVEKKGGVRVSKSRNKHGNKKTLLDGIWFDSELEARGWSELIRLESLMIISDLQRQVPFALAPSVKLHGEKRARPAIRYVADFVYEQGGDTVVADSKGYDTPMSRLKRHLMKTVLGLDVVIIK